ncbi:transposase [Streptomyces sp. NPDC092307]|uniref:IS110 family transposase n=1 Tax=Streptomyces sp. NPDC092307 TaxID=3366013 RepID=UPI00380BDB68
MPSISHPAVPCHIPAPSQEVLPGVDTHKDIHAAAVITVLGAVVDRRGFPATADGYRQLIIWASSVGTLRRAGVECTGSYGKALARHLKGPPPGWWTR